MSADEYPCIFSRQMETIVYVFFMIVKHQRRRGNKIIDVCI